MAQTPQTQCAIIFFRVRSAIYIGAGCIGAPLVLADFKESEPVRCASPVFMLFSSIALVRYHLRTLASFPTPSFFIGTTFKGWRVCVETLFNNASTVHKSSTP